MSEPTLDLTKEKKCPFDENHDCDRHAKHIKNYAEYLQNLAQNQKTEIFTNGGHDDMVCDHKCPIWKAHNGKQR